MQTALGSALGATKGWAAPEVERIHSRVQELCQQLGENSPLLWASMGLWAVHWIRGETRAARRIAEELLQLAQSEQSSSFSVVGHYVTGWSLFYLGEVSSARTHMDHVAAFYNPEQHSSYALFYGVDIGVTSRQCKALALWCLGYPDQALKEAHDSLALVQALSHPFTLAVTLDWMAMLHQLRGERHLTQEQAEAAISLSTEQELPLYLGAGVILRGWALATQGQEKLGISEIRRGLEVWQATGARNTQTHLLALLAEACEKAGQVEEGLVALAEALDFVDRTGERFYEAELYRLKGALTLESQVASRKSQVEEAEACFLKAIAIAQKQQAKSLELRAVMSLARLWRQQAKTTEAHRMLSEIYHWFTEGFDTKDLQEAKTLLEALN